ncbi:MAG TPA: hypothetical protein QF624_04515 [Dehalococcoidia bacterium]|nr:hypothetical protein [Dehalococcoidia bacterium]
MAVVPRTAPAPVLPSFGRRIPLMLLAAIILTAVTAMGIGQVMQTSRTATIGYDLRSLERERGQLAAEIRLLEAGIAQTSRIDEVRAAAVERLGMIEPEETMRIAVTKPAPRLIPLPERFVSVEAPPEPLPLTWWERLISRLPGVN